MEGAGAARVMNERAIPHFMPQHSNARQARDIQDFFNIIGPQMQNVEVLVNMRPNMGAAANQRFASRDEYRAN